MPKNLVGLKRWHLWHMLGVQKSEKSTKPRSCLVPLLCPKVGPPRGRPQCLPFQETKSSWPCVSEYPIGSQTCGFLKIHLKKKKLSSTITTDLECLSLKGPISQYLNIEYKKTQYPNMKTRQTVKLKMRVWMPKLGTFLTFILNSSIFCIEPILLTVTLL